jgi:hypothetical protein
VTRRRDAAETITQATNRAITGEVHCPATRQDISMLCHDSGNMKNVSEK